MRPAVFWRDGRIVLIAETPDGLRVDLPLDVLDAAALADRMRDAFRQFAAGALHA